MTRPDLLDHLIEILERVTATVPDSPEAPRPDRRTRAQELTYAAASEAGAVAGTLALPPGPLGLLTVIPDLIAVWKIQRQLVADIAACYGRTAELGRETMLYCLFRHAAAQVVRVLVVRLGTRLAVRRATVATLEKTVERVGLVVTRRALGRGAARWLPIAGAIGVGAFAFYDTMQVGRTARELFESELAGEPEIPSPA
jgi:hypothetical protein